MLPDADEDRMTLWQWSVARDCWEFCTQAAPASAKAILRGFRRRNPKGTRFRYTAGPLPPRKFRTRRK